MASLMRTLGRWADGQNALNAAPPERRAAAGPVVAAALARLRRHPSLADLATAYHEPNPWFEHLADEFALPAEERETVRAAAHWARLMEIRHPHLAAGRRAKGEPGRR